METCITSPQVMNTSTSISFGIFIIITCIIQISLSQPINPSVLCLRDPLLGFSAQTGEYQQQTNMEINAHPVWKLQGDEGLDGKYGYPGTDAFIYLRDGDGDEDWYWVITHDSDFTATEDTGLVLRCAVGTDIWNPSLCPSWNGFNGTSDSGVSGVNVTDGICPTCSALRAYVEIYAPDLVRGAVKTRILLSSHALFPPYEYNIPYTDSVALPNTDDICDPNASLSTNITNIIVVLFESIGDCTIHRKVLSAEQHGARAVLMANGESSEVINIVDDDTLGNITTSIPVRGITKDTGESLSLASLDWNVPVSIRFKCNTPTLAPTIAPSVSSTTPSLGTYYRSFLIIDGTFISTYYRSFLIAPTIAPSISPTVAPSLPSKDAPSLAPTEDHTTAPTEATENSTNAQSTQESVYDHPSRGYTLQLANSIPFFVFVMNMVMA
eukprot:296889_1